MKHIAFIVAVICMLGLVNTTALLASNSPVQPLVTQAAVESNTDDPYKLIDWSQISDAGSGQLFETSIERIVRELARGYIRALFFCLAASVLWLPVLIFRWVRRSRQKPSDAKAAIRIPTKGDWVMKPLAIIILCIGFIGLTALMGQIAEDGIGDDGIPMLLTVLAGAIPCLFAFLYLRGADDEILRLKKEVKRQQLIKQLEETSAR